MGAVLLLTPLLVLGGRSALARDPQPKPLIAEPINAEAREARASATATPQAIAVEANLILGNAWQEHGPGVISTFSNGNIENVPGNNPACGAVHTLAPHPTDASILYAGAVNGGVWRTTNATAVSPSWTPLTDNFPALCIADLRFDPTDAGSQTLVAGTGRFSNFGFRGTIPAGVLRTTDGGDHWTLLGQADLAGLDIWAVAARGNTILAATASGLFRSTNQGETFQNISGSAGLNAGPVYDLAGDPGDNQRIYAGVGGASGGVFRTDNAGASWTDVTDGAIGAVVGGSTTNLEIAVSADTGNPVFIAIVNNNRLAAVFRSANQGGSWTAMDLPQTMEGGSAFGIHPGGQGDTNTSIAADPTDGNIVYVGGDRQPGPFDGGAFPNSIGANRYSGRIFRGDASVAPTGGVPSPQWTPLTHSGTNSNSAPHPDSREMAFNADGDLLEGDDGGLYRRSSPRTSTGDWYSVFRGGWMITEFHDVAYDDNFDVIIGGSQDNGNVYQTAVASASWVDISGGDGGDVAVDASIPGLSIFYWATQRLGNFSRRTCIAPNVCGGVTSISATVGGGGSPIATQFVTPVELNTQDPTRLIIGGSNSVYESFDQGDNVTELTGPGANRVAMAYGHPDNEDLIVIGSGPQVFVRTTAGGSLNATGGNPAVPPGGNVFVTDVTVDPGNANVMFATNYSANTDASTVSMTRDGGANWTDITGNLTTVSGGNLRTVMYIEGPQNDLLLVGAAQGVFATVEPFGGCWFELGEGLPNTLVYDMDYDRGDDRLLVGTLGRGAWTLDGVALLVAPVTLTSPNGGETLLAGCTTEVTWIVGEGYEDEILNILFSNDGGVTWVPLLTNTPNDGNDIVTLPCEETTEGRILIEVSDKTFCDASDDDFEVVFPTITVVADVDEEFDPPDPWVQDGLVIDTFEISSDDLDLFNVHFVADPLQDQSVPCEGAHTKAIHGDMIEFVPEMVDYLEAGDSMEIEIKITVPVGQHAGEYEGQVHVVAEHECDGCPDLTESFDVAVEVLPHADIDVADNDGNVSDNVFHLVGAKTDLVAGTFTVINPNSAVQNVDAEDGPGNIRVNPVDITFTDLVKVGDPGVAIPEANLSAEALVSLASGEAQVVTLEVQIPDGIPVNAVYQGVVEVTYEGCVGGDQVSDSFGVQVDVLKTQGPLDIVETELVEEFCPDDPWLQVGQVEFEFDIHAYGDHRNVRISSGGLEHEVHDKKLDDFNFFPEEFALISSGETKRARVIVKIPIGQHAGLYSGYFNVVSEDGGQDSVLASIDICPIYDLDIKDHYANLGDNVMVIPAYSRANASGGEWSLKAFDIGLPSNLVNNHDEFDGPSNAPVDSIEYEFSEWSPVWHEDTHTHDLNSGQHFTGTASLDGDIEDWESGEFRRMLVGVFVPPMKGGDNQPGTYRGRLDCWALVDGERVAHDYFEIEVDLARVIGSGKPDLGVFGAQPTSDGALLYWGDFSTLGMSGPVSLYRQNPSGDFIRIQSDLAQDSNYLDSSIDPKLTYNYRLGIGKNGTEILTGTVSVGGIPRRLELFPSFPNPSDGRTMIRYDMPKNGHVSIRIYDAMGRLVRTLKDSEEIAGFRSVRFDGRSDSGRRLPSGVYYCHLIALDRRATQKIVIVR